MSSESSAIVRLISVAQKEQQETFRDGPTGVPEFTDDLRPFRRSYRTPLAVLVVLLLVIVAGLTGAYIGKNYLAETAVVEPAPAAVRTVATPAPAPVASPPVTAVPSDILARTGFDVRVKPHATISLDGRVLGKAPLRVRNLTPGRHVLDIEAPAGYFSRRVELELDAGEPQNVNLALDPIDPAPAPTADVDDDDRDRKRVRRAQRPKSRKTRRAEAEASRPAPVSANGTLMIGSKPPCDIYIDGAATGLKTPQRAIELAAGTHEVTLVNGELDIKKTFTVEIEPGKSTRAIHDLTGKI